MAVSISTKRRSMLPQWIALIGDSTLYQNGNGQTNVTNTLTGLGWNASKIFFYACIGKAISYTDTNGYTTAQNMTQARAALGREPDIWMFNLGGNGHKDTVVGGTVIATQTSWIDAIMDNIASHGSAKAIWIGLSQAYGYDGTATNDGTEATRLYYNSIAQPIVTAYGFGQWADWHGYVKAQPNESTLWLSDGHHNSAAGIVVKNTFYGLSIGPGGG